ncbi:DUF2199 domain-containing protein [Sulfitobacter mediterraneus]|uniref:DUF2199 domain-containing protein n=1 Tax=Sulfitobacter mediterraneus TaxID=83219 RepID=UPI001933888D|nr:DUF2199 domain-containing protein [Sulfitobacter mediterraneus]MBM1633897.1 DUF2199 domain-containing protein [Sulfitobacter mediterraneus]MBM1641588.1 DUF2199 domain-containing protein [Sulfitobacter mediterraneus]MBM1645761.1 DUF2199 domain-containing protein [Sulfitobacter mediterraneus]MBM1649707.1 DUF2199 domain-containing protein [Sulfitobacter mediterraneus]MBM1653830.1 DUF2199 domain-containing protein [Sulfitobacter mediterraneus]
MFERLLRKRSFKYKCNECGKHHEGSPSFSVKYPPYYFDVPETERSNRIQYCDDLCKIVPSDNDTSEDPIYCIRVILEIPIIGASEPFTWGVWITQSEENFEKYTETFETDQSDEQSFGWLPVNLPFYNNTQIGEPLTHLEGEVYWGSKGQRPKVILWKNAHQLAVDQRKGISWKQATKIANQANGGREPRAEVFK